MYCAQCGVTVDSQASFCSNCGASSSAASMSTLVLGQIQPRVIRPLGRIARLASIAIYITMAAVTVRIVGDILLGIYDRRDYPLYGYAPGYRESLVQASRYTELIASNAAFALLLVWFYRLRVNTEVRAPGAITSKVSSSVWAWLPF